MNKNITKEPLVSVITVVFNAETCLEKTILSVINQSYKNVEFIIIDGNSTDGTIDIIKKYQNEINYWISEADAGVYDAMNKGLKKATGDWIYFLGAGDILYDVLEGLIKQFTNPNTIYYGDVYRNDTKSVYDGKFSSMKFAVRNICHQAMFYPSSVFKKYSYNLKYKIQADHALNMVCYGDKEFRFEYISVVVANYDGDGYSANNLDYPFFEDKLELIKSNFHSFVYYYAMVRRKLAKIIK